MIDLTAVLGIARDITVTAALIVALVGLIRRWWVPGWLYDQTKAERDRYERLAYSGVETAETAVKVTKKVVRSGDDEPA